MGNFLENLLPDSMEEVKMNNRLKQVRLQMQRIIGVLFLVVSVFLCFIMYNPQTPEDMSGSLLLAIFGVFLIFNTEYVFDDGEGKKND